MRGLDGSSLIQTVRGSSWGNNCLLIAHTGWVSKGADERTGGFDYVVTKPNVFELLRLLSEARITEAKSIPLSTHSAYCL